MTITISSSVGLDGRAAEHVFVDRLRPLLPLAHRLAHGMLHDPHEAEDAVQEAILNAWRAFGQLRSDSNARAWFLKIVANQCRQRRRNRWWSVLRQADLPDEVDPGPGVALEDADELRRSLARLPHDQRLVVMLHFYLDLPFDEVGRVLGITGQAARSRAHRAIRRLRLDFEEVIDGE
jgi:RNA polymerase sigma factor (sigma-70 family)